MHQVRRIDTLELPELQPYRTLRLQAEHRQQGIFVAEGEKVVRRLLESRFAVLSVLLPQAWFERLQPLIAARPEEVRVFLAEKKLLETLTGFSMYQGLLAVGKIPPAPALESILESGPHPLLLAAVDGLSNAENMGAVVRNCRGLGAGALIVGETCGSPYLRRAVRSSMGAIFELPVLETSDLCGTLARLRAAGVRCVAAHPHAPATDIMDTDLTRPTCVVFGSEGYGISPRVLAACDQPLRIPMPESVDSLNVASAAAVFLYEAGRQRRLPASVAGQRMNTRPDSG